MDRKNESNTNADEGNEEPKSDEAKKIENIIEVGKFYFINKKYREALEQFESCLSLDPENEEILLSIGLIHEINNEVEEAKNTYKKILKKNPDNKSAKEKLNKLSGL